ncbi:MAG: inositol monophosphatase family protein [Nevskiales bacterium]
MSQSLFLRTALAAARAADVVIRKYYKSGLAVHTKPDASPVTQADVESEAAIKAVLAAEFPDHGFYGEELGQQALDAEYVWLIDPIDGTKAFVRGYPVFSAQIALMHRGEWVLGVSSAPCWNMETGELAYAEQGQGAYLNGQRIQVSTVEMLEQATLSTGNIASLAQSPRWNKMGGLIPRLHRIRGYGDFLHYHWLASGKLDAVIESDISILDIAALSVIVREAGGDFTDLEGAPLTLKTTSVLATNGRLRPLLTQALN